ncbi:MAG: hypothetical protein QW738_04035 [Nitrososphaeria archaeon]
MNIKRKIRIYSLILLIVTMLGNAVVISSSANSEDYLQHIESIVVKLEKASEEGLNTSKVEQYLNNALSLLSNGNLTTIEENWVNNNLTLADEELNSLTSNLNSYVFWKNVKLILTIGLIASIPILTYLFLPRIWAYAWFKTRRKWIVKKK